MATGSRRWFGYLSDDGSNFAVELDESTYETAALGFTPVDAGALVIKQGTKRPLSMRHVNLARQNAGVTLRKKVYVGSQQDLTDIIQLGSLTIDSVVWSLSSYTGEARKLVPRFDTEQLDGDVDDNLL